MMKSKQRTHKHIQKASQKKFPTSRPRMKNKQRTQKQTKSIPEQIPDLKANDEKQKTHIRKHSITRKNAHR